MAFDNYGRYYDVVVINAVSSLDGNSIIRKLCLRENDIKVMEGGLWSFSFIGFGFIKCNTLIIIGHGCNNAIASSTKANILNYIIHGPLGVLGFISTMYIPYENERYIALTLNFFKYSFNPQAERIIIISCDVKELTETLIRKGYIVYVLKNLKPLEFLLSKS